MAYERITLRKEDRHMNSKIVKYRYGDKKGSYRGVGEDTLYDRLAELEDKIEQGLMIDLPCKVGDTIFYVYDYGSVSGECIALDEGKVDGVSHQIDGVWVHARYESGLTYWHIAKEIGESIFLTREEAEAKLKELQNGNT